MSSEGLRNYYEILQVSPNAETEVIEAAYRRLARRYHPDVDSTPGATERMRLLNEAYDVLHNPENRRSYDTGRHSSADAPPRTGGSTTRRSDSNAAPTSPAGRDPRDKTRRPWLSHPLFIVAGVAAIITAFSLVLALLDRNDSSPELSQETGLTQLAPTNTSPAYSTFALSTPVPQNLEDLAFLGSDGRLRLVLNGASRLIDVGPCGSRFLWSPTGDKVACFNDRRASIYGLEGQLLGTFSDAGQFSWSPTGDKVAYNPSSPRRTIVIASVAGNELDRFNDADLGQAIPPLHAWAGGDDLIYQRTDRQLVIRNVVTHQELSLGVEALPYAWLTERGSLIATNYRDPPNLNSPQYEVYLADFRNGSMIHLDQFDNALSQYWISPDSNMLAFTGPRLTPPKCCAGVSILQLAEGRTWIIQGSALSYGSSHVRHEYVSFSADGTLIFWYDAQSLTINQARVDGTGSISTFGPIGYYSAPVSIAAGRMWLGFLNVDQRPGAVPQIWLRRIDSGEQYRLAEGSAFAWRPMPA